MPPELEPIRGSAHATTGGLIIRSECLGRNAQFCKKCRFAQIDDVLDLDVERIEGEGVPFRCGGERRELMFEFRHESVQIECGVDGRDLRWIPPRPNRVLLLRPSPSACVSKDFA